MFDFWTWQDLDSLNGLVVKWSTICDSNHKNPSIETLTLSSPTSTFSSSIQPLSTLHHLDWPVIKTNKYRRQDSVTPDASHLRLFIPEHDEQNTINSAASSSDGMEVEHALSRFKEMNAENLATLCDALRSKEPWQEDIISEIAKTVLKCRSGSTKRKINGNNDIK